MNATIYQIPEANLSKLQAKIADLTKRAKRMGLVPPMLFVGQPHEEHIVRTEMDLDGTTIEIDEYVTFFPCTIEGESPKFAGWSFVASCDYHEEPVVIRQFVKETETERAMPEKFRSLGPVCEHCKTKRARKDCFVLRHDDGSWIQVGRSCLKDFLGHPNPEHLVQAASWLKDVEDACGHSADDRESVRFLPGVAFVLSWASSTIARLGWTPKSKDDTEFGGSRVCTARIVRESIEDYLASIRYRTSCKFPRPTDNDRARADAAIAWAKNLTGSSEYEQNIRALTVRQSVEPKNFGMVVSIVAAYDRAMQNKREVANSEHVGTVGDRLRDVRVSCERVIELGDYGYGMQRINVMRDENGNVLVWKSGKALETGGIFMATGTVKAHSEYKGRKQTDLTRCSVEHVGFEVPSAA